MMKRFGFGWARLEGVTIVPTPIGEPCFYCRDPIKPDDLGVVMPFSGGTPEYPTECEINVHRVCLLRNIGVEGLDEAPLTCPECSHTSHGKRPCENTYGLAYGDPCGCTRSRV